jgi:hypothetical protein
VAVLGCRPGPISTRPYTLILKVQGPLTLPVAPLAVPAPHLWWICPMVDPAAPAHRAAP